MTARLMMWCTGCGLAAGGGICLIAYLNYIPAGLSFLGYFMFVSRRMETIIFAIGLLLMAASICFPEKYR
ncbi:hypothetical protein [Alteribacillus iranensis]|uniref:Uncharacterized protein n=1 Tax=Alteribacillus iranensis TaxID=930128 RepID=A0A1I2CY57_9BACI|nr:hypothetical protein [Alteribacillus iranensis]SFE73162.1 hypothetical protein SAMN05192532_103276 [Alteribacillus iranensis]